MTVLPSVEAAVARAGQVETLQVGADVLELLLDADATAGALSAHRVSLYDGSVGATPHHHALSSELFFVLDGRVDVLAGDGVLSLGPGDLVVVPPDLPHAFAASAGHSAQLLVVITPGVRRFPFFRDLVRVLHGQADRAAFLRSQPDYDTYPSDPAVWSTSR